MLDLLEKLETKSQLAERELLANSRRSDREIGRLLGVDHKTVSAARARLGNLIASADDSPLEDTPTNRRRMLIAGVKDFNARYPDASGETAEEVVDRAVAEGKVTLAPDEDENYAYWSIPAQVRIECRAKDRGSVEVWQGIDDADEGQAITVSGGNAVMLARHILYASGFRAVGIYTQTPRGNEDLEDGDLAGSFYDE